MMMAYSTTKIVMQLSMVLLMVTVTQAGKSCNLRGQELAHGSMIDGRLHDVTGTPLEGLITPCTVCVCDDGDIQCMRHCEDNTDNSKEKDAWWTEMGWTQ